MTKRLVYFNGKFVDESEAKISIYDSALMFGDMVFEMTRSFNKKQFLLDEHIDRLYSSAEYEETVKRNTPSFDDTDEHRLMINVTRGTLSIYQESTNLNNGTNVIISDFPLRWTVQTMGPLYNEGINVVVTNQKIIPASLLEPKVKSRSRLHYMMANIEASRQKGSNNWALLTDPDGFIAEGTGSNFVIVKNGSIISPEPRNILRGISLDFIKKLSNKLDIPFIEKNFEPYDVMFADEAFMTGTPFCILPVTSIHNKNIGNGQMGKITKSLLSEWSKEVGVAIDEQIMSWYNESFEGVTPYAIQKK